MSAAPSAPTVPSPNLVIPPPPAAKLPPGYEWQIVMTAGVPSWIGRPVGTPVVTPPQPQPAPAPAPVPAPAPAPAPLPVIVPPPQPIPVTPLPQPAPTPAGPKLPAIVGPSWTLVLVLVLVIVGLLYDRYHFGPTPVPPAPVPGPPGPGPIPPAPQPNPPVAGKLHVTLVYDPADTSREVAALRTSATIKPALNGMDAIWRNAESTSAEVMLSGLMAYATPVGLPAVVVQDDTPKHTVVKAFKLVDETGLVAAVKAIRSGQ